MQVNVVRTCLAITCVLMNIEILYDTNEDDFKPLVLLLMDASFP